MTASVIVCHCSTTLTRFEYQGSHQDDDNDYNGDADDDNDDDDDNDVDKVAFAALFISSVVILYRFVNCVFKSILFINFHIQLAIVFFISHAGPASDNSWRKTQLQTEKIGGAVEK